MSDNVVQLGIEGPRVRLAKQFWDASDKATALSALKKMQPSFTNELDRHVFVVDATETVANNITEFVRGKKPDTVTEQRYHTQAFQDLKTGSLFLALP